MNLEQYTFSRRPFIESHREYDGQDGAKYSERDFMYRSIPDDAYPVTHRIHGEYGEPEDVKTTLVPCSIWDDASIPASDYEPKVIMIDKSSLSMVEIPEVSEPQKDGYRLIAKGTGARTTCPRCGSAMRKIGGSQGEWTTYYACDCGGLIDLNHADMGGLDSWEYFEPIRP